MIPKEIEHIIDIKYISRERDSLVKPVSLEILYSFGKSMLLSWLLLLITVGSQFSNSIVIYDSPLNSSWIKYYGRLFRFIRF